jgi:hypothetical protein
LGSMRESAKVTAHNALRDRILVGSKVMKSSTH